jgi:hypothetical protein
MPMALSLIDAIAGRATAERVAADVGVIQWDISHDSHAFQFTRPFALTAIGNTLAVWNRERLGLHLESGVDEVALALVADAWSRTYRSRAVTWSETKHATETRNGVRIRADKVVATWPAAHAVPAVAGKPARALEDALAGITARYGRRTAEFVAMQLEYPWTRADRSKAA